MIVIRKFFTYIGGVATLALAFGAATGGLSSGIGDLLSESQAEASQTKNGNGEIVIKYTAPDVDLDTATEDDLKLLEEVGWIVDEDGTLTIERTLDEFELDHDHDSDSHQVMDTSSLSVNDSQTTLNEDGTFNVAADTDEVEVQFGGHQAVTAEKDVAGNYTAVFEVDLSETLFAMDDMSDVEGDFTTQGTLSPVPPHGTRYSPGQMVHCNRFNGPQTDDVHYAHSHWRAYYNFVLSDCDYGVGQGYCSIISGNDKCNRPTRAECSLDIGHSRLYHRH
ncbi:hypothetical protein DH09_00995 (plasmid) [Bacillaceae bacterium JMAK1]|nr:hypothetical protein DH09_00995 [Bacillaceae bacterium JMAK1]